MGWKKALFFGGAVLVLSACDRVTAPTSSLSRHESAPAAAKKNPATTATPSSTDGTYKPAGDPNNMGLCSGWSVRTGDSLSVCLEP
jgi:hypothetical protein